MSEIDDESTPKKAEKSTKAKFDITRKLFFVNAADLLQYKDKYTHLVFEYISAQSILSELEKIKYFSQYLKSVEFRFKELLKNDSTYSEIDKILETLSEKAQNIEMLKFSINKSIINDQLMFKSIPKFTKLDSFYININNSCFPESILEIVKQIDEKKIKKLHFSLSQCDYDKSILDQLKFFNNLESLKLNLSDNQCNNFSFGLIKQLLDKNPDLNEINLDLNFISNFSEFDDFLISLSNHKDQIKSIKFSAYGNNLTVEQTINLMHTLSKMENLQILKLDLRKNCLNGIYENEKGYKKLFIAIEGLKSILKNSIEETNNLKIFY